VKFVYFCFKINFIIDFRMFKFTIYQVLPRLFGAYASQQVINGTLEMNGCGKFSSFSTYMLREIKSMGITHVWYTGIIEHATKTDYSNLGIRPDHPKVVKGMAGSPYAIKDYYDVCPDLAEQTIERMSEFEQLVMRTHAEGLRVIIDFVPNHVAREYYSDVRPLNVKDLGEADNSDHAFSPDNNFYYLPGQCFAPHFDKGSYEECPAKATGNDQFTPSPSISDWYETIKLNYGVDYLNGGQTHFDPVPDTWLKMRDILLFWASKGVDGFRCDMAEMVPVAFWEWALIEVKKQFPDLLFIAEVYNPSLYRDYLFRGGFDYLYDKVGLYDTLRGIICHRWSATAITSCWQALSGIEDRMLNFMENHDEQRIASDFFAGDPWLAIPALVVSSTLTKAPFMLYFGQELGERGMDQEGFSGLDGRTSIFDYWAVESIQRWISKEGRPSHDQLALRAVYIRMMQLLLDEKSLKEGAMFDLQYANLSNEHYNAHRQFAFFRNFEDERVLIVVNFDRQQVNIQLKIPTEALNFIGLREGVEVCFWDLLDTEVVRLQEAFATSDDSRNGYKPVRHQCVLSADTLLPMSLCASSAAIIKIIVARN
jgi:glycosidase